MKSLSPSSRQSQTASNIFVKFFAIAIVFLVLFVVGVATVEAVVKPPRGGAVTPPPKKCNYTHYCHYEIVKDGITYDVTGSATYQRICGNGAFPAWGCDFIKSEIIDRIGPDALSQTWGLACGNTHRYSATIVGINGACGGAAGNTFSSFPTSNLCTSGPVVSTSSSPTTYDWVCGGTNGGSNVSCSAEKPEFFSLSCTPSPLTGVINQPVNFTASITGTTTPLNQFTYTWNVNGTDYNDDHIRTQTFTQATATAKVTVTATRGNATQVETCPFNRVDCTTGQTYCGDVGGGASYSCAATPAACPSSSCGVGYDISMDRQLDPGGSLSITTPNDTYVSTNNLCAAGSVLRYANGNPQWTFSLGYSTWRWECKHPSATNIGVCKARCKTGEYYCSSKNKCIPDSENCNCTLAEGDIVDQREYCIDDRNGQCYACGKVIRYFSLAPSEVPKDQTEKLCGGFWQTNEITEAQMPEGATDARVVCEMKSGATTGAVPANNPAGGTGHNLEIGTHILTCTQQYKIGESGDWLDLLSSTLDARCRALPGIIER